MSQYRKIKAGSVHVLTSLGAVCALFAVRATVGQAFEQAYAWLGLALLIDGIDGYFARRFAVKTVLPHVSGETLDLCVDYVTYVFVPALMLVLGPLPGTWGMMLAALICITSLYHFSDERSKSEDHCFVGFPAIWNIVAFYIFALALPDWASSLLILACCALTFVRWKWVHPMRVVARREFTLALTGVWALDAATILWSGFPAGWATSFVIVSIAVYSVVLSLLFGRASHAEKSVE